MAIGQKSPRSSNCRHYAQPLTTPRTARRRSCLRKDSAFTSDVAPRGSRLDELSTTKTITVSYSSRKPKKTVSFADQRGQCLVLEREFGREDAPVCYCDSPSEVTVDRLISQRRGNSVNKWMEETLAHQHLLSMCIVSLIGCAFIGFRPTTK
ncbi:unnamed protein product [Hyaloperonospora brassicae]|uniref:RxLR effector candidate protein n=1 Tax=Hyaloperonospora brassicae TaxID=162125 RepID=A0AAV0SZA9_HYABA|nr:unnamed protein product [Hyaloperonospora brassicae]